jgi:hypothetical protein
MRTIACAIISEHKELIAEGDGEQFEDNLFWCNEDGWVDLLSADFFNPDEIESLSLPEGGTWVVVNIDTEFKYINGAYVTNEIMTIER